MGATCVLWIYTPEIFPTNIRTLGLGMSSSISRIAGMITPYIATVLIKFSPSIPVGIYGGSCLLAFVLSHLLPYETNGRALANDTSDVEHVIGKRRKANA